MSPGEWIGLVGLCITNIAAIVGVWTNMRVTIKTLDMRITQLEFDRHELRKDVKGLTIEVHNLVVELAKGLAQHRGEH